MDNILVEKSLAVCIYLVNADGQMTDAEKDAIKYLINTSCLSKKQISNLGNVLSGSNANKVDFSPFQIKEDEAVSILYQMAYVVHVDAVRLVESKCFYDYALVLNVQQDVAEQIFNDDNSVLEPDKLPHPSDPIFDDVTLWDKITKQASKAGRDVIEKVLVLYFAATSSNTPVWAKCVIFAALTYFILPFDAIPDVILGVGYSDDLACLVASMGTVSAFISSECKEKANVKIYEWFDK